VCSSDLSGKVQSLAQLKSGTTCALDGIQFTLD